MQNISVFISDKKLYNSVHQTIGLRTDNTWLHTQIQVRVKGSLNYDTLKN